MLHDVLRRLQSRPSSLCDFLSRLPCNEEAKLGFAPAWLLLPFDLWTDGHGYQQDLEARLTACLKLMMCMHGLMVFSIKMPRLDLGKSL